MHLQGLVETPGLTGISFTHPSGLRISIKGPMGSIPDQIDLRELTICEITMAVPSDSDLPLVPHQVFTEQLPVTPISARAQAISDYRSRHRCSVKEVAARAAVSPRTLRAWRSGDLPDTSIRSIRIERLLQRGICSA